MTSWALFRFAKFVCVALLSVAVLGGVFGRDAATRRRLSQGLGTFALLGVMASGYALAKKTGVSIGEPWVSRGLLAGLVAFGGACWGGVRDEVRPSTVAVAVGGLLGAFGWMSARTLGQSWILGAAIPAAVAIPVALRWRSAPSQDPARQDATMRWFAWLARAEGVSLLLLFGVYMPLKHGAGVVLDGGQGWFGWMHGVLQLLYLVALVVTARVHGWGLRRQALGFVASLLPLATFVFERRVRPQ
ncbi:MAG: DUF3817 domain-containing protein [Nannocystaceae bacterium]|nr:DUF3817 domain-containing protein [bacterium]